MLARGGELRMNQRISEILLNDDKTVRCARWACNANAMATIVPVTVVFGTQASLAGIAKLCARPHVAEESNTIYKGARVWASSSVAL